VNLSLPLTPISLELFNVFTLPSNGMEVRVERSEERRTESFLTHSQHVKMCAASRSDERLQLTLGCLADHTRYRMVREGGASALPAHFSLLSSPSSLPSRERTLKIPICKEWSNRNSSPNLNDQAGINERYPPYLSRTIHIPQEPEDAFSSVMMSCARLFGCNCRRKRHSVDLTDSIR
jgi:hypothetical protein